MATSRISQIVRHNINSAGRLKIKWIFLWYPEKPTILHLLPNPRSLKPYRPLPTPIFLGRNIKPRLNGPELISLFAPRMKSFALLAILPCLFGCEERSSQSQAPTYGDLSDALALLDADGREGAYVIAEDPENQNYVQFGIMDSEWIHFDVPSYIDQTKEFEPDHAWNIVTELPALDGATRRHFIDPTRGRELWQYLSDGRFDPYHFRSVYKQQSQAIAATESICFNLPRVERDRCQLAASKVFELTHGYPAPKRLKFTSDQTDWVPPPKDKGEKGGTGHPATRAESKSGGSDKPQPDAKGRSR